MLGQFLTRKLAVILIVPFSDGPDGHGPGDFRRFFGSGGKSIGHAMKCHRTDRGFWNPVRARAQQIAGTGWTPPNSAKLATTTKLEVLGKLGLVFGRL